MENTPKPLNGSPLFLGYLAAAYALAYLDRLMMAVVAEPVKQEFQLSDSELFFLTGAAFVLIYGFCGILSGWLLDRFDRPRMIAWSLAAWSLCTAACGLASNFAMLAVARAGVGIGESAIVPAGMATISDRYPEEKRPMAMGIFYAGGMIGILLAWVVGGWVTENWGWRYAFFLAAPPGLLLAAMIARHGASLRISAKASTDAPPKAEQSGPSTFGIVLGNRPLMWLIAAGSIVTFVNIGLVTQLGSFFIRSHGMTLTQVGLVFGPIMAAGMALGLLGGGAIGNRLAKRGPAALILFSAATTLCMVPLYAITLLAEGLAPALAAMFVANVCSVLYSPAFSAAYQSVCPASARATAAGISGCTNAVIGGALTTWAVGMLSDAWMPRFGVDSLRYAMLAGLATCFLSAAMFLHARRLVQRSIRP